MEILFCQIGAWLRGRRAWLTLAVCATSAFADTPSVRQAEAQYQQTRYAQAIRLLESLPGKNADAWALLGKAYYGEGDFKASVHALEQAVETAPENGSYWNWLGRAYGRHAEAGSFFKAYGRAKKCRAAFEKAVDLAPQSVQALTDLFSYYLNAPGFLGGGTAKAEAMAKRISEVDRVEYESALAQLAKKREDWEAAERHYRNAMDLDPEPFNRLLDLAVFLAERGRIEESDGVFAEAAKLRPRAPELLYARARAFLKADRKRDEARRLLEQYLAADLTPDDPPRWEVRRVLDEAGG